MLINLLFGFPTMMLCLSLQTILLVVAIRYYRNHRHLVNNASLWASLIVLNGVLLPLVVGNLGQIAVWALLFMLLGEFQQFSTAFYHSAVNFCSLGYGDIVMSDTYRLLGALEALNGVLMVGVSTAALMVPFKEAIQKAREKRAG